MKKHIEPDQVKYENILVKNYGVLMSKADIKRALGIKTHDNTEVDSLIGGLPIFLIGKSVKYCAADVAAVIYNLRI